MNPLPPLRSAFLLPAVVTSLPGTLWAEEYYTVEEALELAFPGADAFDKTRVIVSAQQKAALEERVRAARVTRVYSYYVARRAGVPVGYAVVDNVLGKSQPITYLTAVGLDLSVQSIEVLVYRESHGYEIRQNRFRSQFPGKSTGSRLRLHADIDNIAGATISCNSVTNGVHDVLAYLDVLVGAAAAAPAAAEREASSAEPDSAAPLAPFSRAQVLMGTTLELTVYAPSREAAAAAMGRAFAEVARLEELWSLYRPASEVSRLNAAAGGRAVALSPETLDLLRLADRVSHRTGGAFEVATAPLTRLWKDAPGRGAPPDAEALADALRRSGPGVLELGTGEARLRVPGAGVDLGGIGKGYALERAARVLEDCGVHAALLNFGGNVLALDPPPGQEAWRVPVRDPRGPADGGAAPLAELRLARGAAATTADYERGLLVGGRRYSHVVDPRSGRPAEGSLAVTVVAPGAAEADAYSTALFVLGAEAAASFAEEQGLSALIVPPRGALRTSGSCRDLPAPPAPTVPIAPPE